MKKKNYLIKFHYLFILVIPALLFSCEVELETPLERSGYEEPTSHEELLDFVEDAVARSENMEAEIIGQSYEGRDIPAVKISRDGYGTNPEMAKMLIFAQLHGNEQASKEGALLLIKEFAKGNLDEFLPDIDLIVVPQMNPDGSEENQRRNAQDIDLNRDHLALESPENQALHNLFVKYMPEINVDVHEYYPYGSSWEDYGYRRDFDMQIGLLTNINVPEELREYQNEVFLPYMQEQIEGKGYSFHNYLVGGVPGDGKIRYSTVDMNDGRQSVGILGTFSVIYEGMNGRDRYAENIEERTKCQYESMVALLEFTQANKDDIKSVVEEGREELKAAEAGQTVAIETEYVKGDEPLELPLVSFDDEERDTTVTVEEFYPYVEMVNEVEMPSGYLLPYEDEQLLNLLQRHNVEITGDFIPEEYNIYRYTNVDNIDNLTVEQLEELPADVPYVYVPIGQLHSRMVTLALEPESEIGLVNYDEFEHLTEESDYPILRVYRR